MGVPTSTLNDLPSSDDLDTDTVRRKALMALEGRSADTGQVLASFSKVQIPELDTPDEEKKFEMPLKSTFQFGNNILGKRDSFPRVLTPSLSSKDQLHTLLEEDEEEEEDSKRFTIPQQTSSYVRPRATDALTPLTLTPLVVPAPSQPRPGLKPLTLATSPPLISPSSGLASIRIADAPKRRSSLSYKRSEDGRSPRASSTVLHLDGLPTPELTPVTAERPLSPSEQNFLHKNHTSLLCRISELERVLAMRTRSMSTTSTSSRQLSVSSITSEPPSDEMLCLVRDLKAERDDLTRDVGVWQTRVEDLEHQIGLLTRRVENERRDAWQAREKAGLLELQRNNLQCHLDESHVEMARLRNTLANSQKTEKEAVQALEVERSRRFIAERDSEALARTPRVRESGFHSVTSFASSNTDVDFDLSIATVPLKPVIEEDEDVNSDETDELAHYEDEDDDDDGEDVGLFSDDSFTDSRTNVSFNSFVPDIRVDSLGLPIAAAPPLPSPSSAASMTPPVTPSPIPAVAHVRTRSLEQNWSFPKGAQPSVRPEPEIDRFFECLQLVDTPPSASMTSLGSFPGSAATGKDKYGFFSNDDLYDEDQPPFILPAIAHSSPSLDIVFEQDEDDSPMNWGVRDSRSPAFERYESASNTNSVFTCRMADGLDEYKFARREGNDTSYEPIIQARLPKVPSFTSKASVAASSDAPLPQTPPRKVQLSSIPRLSPSAKATSTNFPPTPVSNPRLKVGSGAPPVVKYSNPSSSFLNTPTKPVSARGLNTNAHTSKFAALGRVVRPGSSRT